MIFLELGRQPLANGFLTKSQFSEEIFYDLKMNFDEETKLVSLVEQPSKEILFNENYPYHSSCSATMRKHFKDIANEINKFNPKLILEIGSNDGVFIRHFDPKQIIAVEPCGNFASFTRDLGYQTYNEFWTNDIAQKIVENHGKVDVVYAANCMCHIMDIEATFKSISEVLSPDGVFIFEDPSLQEVLETITYDQFYDEHAHLFSIIALKKLLERNELKIFKIEKTSVHGGSNRIYAGHSHDIQESVDYFIWKELETGLQDIETYYKFTQQVQKSKNDLISLLEKSKDKCVIGYGATSKSTIIYNYCNIDSNLVKYVIDTTPDKQNKYTPGTHIPILSPEIGWNDSVDMAFLGAWNYLDEILSKEINFRSRGGKFITHKNGIFII